MNNDFNLRFIKTLVVVTFTIGFVLGAIIPRVVPYNELNEVNPIESYKYVMNFSHDYSDEELRIISEIQSLLIDELFAKNPNTGTNDFNIYSYSEMEDLAELISDITYRIFDICGFDADIVFADLRSDSDTNHGGFTTYTKKLITINEKLECSAENLTANVTVDNLAYFSFLRSMSDKQSLIKGYFNTLLHEIYHFMQFVSVYEGNKYNIDNDSLSMYKNNFDSYCQADDSYYLYQYQPVEVTARDFASKVLSRVPFL